MGQLHKELFEQKLIDENQYQFLDAIHQRTVVSVFYDLRLLLYLGIMLFTAGIGYIVYQNLSDLGHIILMLLLLVCIVIGGYYIQSKVKPYSKDQIVVEHFYFDYILVLVSLLIISLFTYVQVYFELVELLLQWTSFITAGIFLLIAYRYDNKMVLSLGITALAAGVGLAIIPIDWVTGEWFSGSELYFICICFGIVLLVAGQALSHFNIKKHFTFTYHNFGLLLVYFAGLSMIFDSSHEYLAAFLLLALTVVVGVYSWKSKLFLFFLYSSLSGYIAFTYLLVVADFDELLLAWYFPVSCITGIILLVKNRSHFTNE